MFLTILIIVLVILLICLFVKLSIPFTKKVINNAIDIACYVDTYHYTKNTKERIKIGKDKFYKSLFKEDNSFYKSKTDYIFEVFYTRIFTKLLNVVPVEVTRKNNRCLSDGEERNSGKIFDEYFKKQETQYKRYATTNEISNIDTESKES